MAAKATKAAHEPEYEFLGIPGASFLVFGLPLILYSFTFLCNDISGCPAPSMLSPSTLKLTQLKREVGWPEEGIVGLFDLRVFGCVIGYYFFSLLLYRILPAQEVMGSELASGGRLKYRFNAFNSTLVTLTLAAAGTIAQGAEFPLWTYITDNFVQILTANVIITYALSIYVYVGSFNVKPGDPNHRLLAPGGQTGSVIYDFFIGREMNPRVTLPFFGEIDIKEFCEIRPGLTGWIVLNLAWVAQQYRNYGFVSDSIIFVTIVQALYVLDGQYMEYAILTTMDIKRDGFGFMLAAGDLIWLPFLYSIPAKYLSVYPVTLGPTGLAAVSVVLAIGLFIFRRSNSQKNTFRTNPADPSVASLSYIETKTGSRLLTSGWWGMARHINYLGDWIQAWPYTLVTGMAGYTILSAGTGAEGAFKMADGREVVQGAARGWGIIFCYFYLVYFAILLIHRERRDDAWCEQRYGASWREYKRVVPSRIIPGIY